MSIDKDPECLCVSRNLSLNPSRAKNAHDLLSISRKGVKETLALPTSEFRQLGFVSSQLQFEGQISVPSGFRQMNLLSLTAVTVSHYLCCAATEVRALSGA
jgi:hypothetical protein